jgi:hypothetical protein
VRLVRIGRRAPLGALLAVLAATTAVPARAAGATVLRLSGRSTGYVDVTLTRPTTFDEQHARLGTRGTYVGWWITRLGEPVRSRSHHAGGVRFAADSASGEVYPHYDLGFSEDPLPPGRYRLYLATDGPSLVEVPASGLPRSLSLSPVRPTRSAATLRTVAPLAGGFARGSMREPVTLEVNALAVSAVFVHSDPGLGVEGFGACVAPPGASCDDPGQPGGWWGWTYAPSQDYSVGVIVHYDPGTLPPGRYDGVQGATAGPGVRRVVGTLFHLTTVP